MLERLQFFLKSVKACPDFGYINGRQISVL